VQLTADAFFGASSRGAAVTVAGTRVNVTQDGTGCTLEIAPTAAAIGSAGGSRTIAVTANENCSWQAESRIVWITIAAPESGSGNGSVTYNIAPNASADERVGLIIIEGQAFTVTQAGG